MMMFMKGKSNFRGSGRKNDQTLSWQSKFCHYAFGENTYKIDVRY